MMSLKEKILALAPADERLELSSWLNALGTGDNDPLFYGIYLTLRAERGIPTLIDKSLKHQLGAHLDEARELQTELSGKGILLKVILSRVATALITIVLTVLAGWGTFAHLSHDLSKQVFLEQATRLNDLGEQIKSISEKQARIENNQLTLLQNQKLLGSSQADLAKQVAGSAAEVQKSIEASKGVINEEKEGAVKAIKDANFIANTIKEIGLMLKLPGTGLMKSKDGGLDIWVNDDAVSVTRVLDAKGQPTGNTQINFKTP
jgi:hypothetical protein